MRSKVSSFLLLVIGSFASFIIFLYSDHFGKIIYARPTLFSIIIEIVAIKVCWNLRGYLWFWAIVIAFSIMHGAIICLYAKQIMSIPFPLLFLLCILDELTILALIGVVEKWSQKSI
jgi:hypothetical protein